ncbi:thioredoxin domain-containing protein [Candidatus Electronema sp. TJ]|uniref:thioredoxin domain-containing protein n=1 Tax=Candidatus Electronema sp. TJ TaxID=3401573 RepID=UPI003AA9951E
MKKTLALCCLLLLPGQTLLAQTPAQTPEGKPDTLSWTPIETWKADVKPRSFAQTLDGRMVFILGEDSKVHLYSTEGQKLGVIPAEPGTVALDISPRGEMLYLMDQNGSYQALDISLAKDIDIAGAPFLGKETAPVAIVVFSDFQCPFCNRVHPLLEEVMKRNPETVKVLFKHMPLNMHQQAEPAARAAIAAQEQGKFWQMHDALFAVSSSLSPETIEKAAAGIGLDMEKFKADWNSQATKDKLAKDLTSARLAEVNGTPTIFVNGRRVNAPSPDIIQKMIDQELKKKK